MRLEIETLNHGLIWYDIVNEKIGEIYEEVVKALQSKMNLTLPTTTGWTIVPFEVLSTSIIRINKD